MPMGRADRLFRIVQRLRRRGATTARQLAEALEVSERTVFYRDVRDLLSSGVPIQGEAGVGYALDRVPGHTLADFLALMAAEERAIKNVQSHTTK
jgi:predicted DNA-binding transcriptional regulator YafY